MGARHQDRLAGWLADCRPQNSLNLPEVRFYIKGNNKKNLVMVPRWGPGTKKDWLTYRWSQNNLNLKPDASYQLLG
jgi:hypothetical protein